MKTHPVKIERISYQEKEHITAIKHDFFLLLVLHLPLKIADGFKIKQQMIVDTKTNEESKNGVGRKRLFNIVGQFSITSAHKYE